RRTRGNAPGCQHYYACAMLAARELHGENPSWGIQRSFSMPACRLMRQHAAARRVPLGLKEFVVAQRPLVLCAVALAPRFFRVQLLAQRREFLEVLVTQFQGARLLKFFCLFFQRVVDPTPVLLCCALPRAFDGGARSRTSQRS